MTHEVSTFVEVDYQFINRSPFTSAVINKFARQYTYCGEQARRVVQWCNG